MTTNAITAVPGIRVGHVHDAKGLTGVTVILADGGATAGVDVRGGAPGTMGTDALRPANLVQHVDAIVLTGGSAFGLASVTGVRRYLEEQGVGLPFGTAHVPIVGGAVIFDLPLGDPMARPDADMGYAACVAASADEARNGNVGAGMGATVGKLRGLDHASKAGVGNAAVELAHGLVVAALFVVNAGGDVVDPETNRIVAGVRTAPDHAGPDAFADARTVMRSGWEQQGMPDPVESNTVIGCIATNARLTKEQCTRVAMMAHDGLGRAVRPAHTMYDGDVIFALSNGDIEADVNLVGAFAAEATAQAIVNGARFAAGAGGLPGAADT